MLQPLAQQSAQAAAERVAREQIHRAERETELCAQADAAAEEALATPRRPALTRMRGSPSTRPSRARRSTLRRPRSAQVREETAAAIAQVQADAEHARVEFETERDRVLAERAERAEQARVDVAAARSDADTRIATAESTAAATVERTLRDASTQIAAAQQQAAEAAEARTRTEAGQAVAERRR